MAKSPCDVITNLPKKKKKKTIAPKKSWVAMFFSFQEAIVFLAILCYSQSGDDLLKDLAKLYVNLVIFLKFGRILALKNLKNHMHFSFLL